MSYATLRDYFKRDPAISWGAYVAGCLLVLAREKGVQFDDGISILICSDVPEGEPLLLSDLGQIWLPDQSGQTEARLRLGVACCCLERLPQGC